MSAHRRQTLSRWSLLLWFATVVLLPAPARAETLEQAREAYLDAEFREAEMAFAALLRSGELSRDEAAEAQVYLAAIGLLTDRAEEARAHARAAVALSPGVSAPVGAAEALLSLLDRERRALRGQTLQLRLQAEGALRLGRSVEITARLGPLALDLVSELALRCTEPGTRPLLTRGDPPEVRLRVTPAAERITCEARALDPAGLSLLWARQAFEPSRRLSPWLWVGIALGAAAIVAIVVGVALAFADPQAGVIDQVTVEGW